MALFDFLKKKKKEEIDKAMTLETPVLDNPITEPQEVIKTDPELVNNEIVEISSIPFPIPEPELNQSVKENPAPEPGSQVNNEFTDSILDPLKDNIVNNENTVREQEQVFSFEQPSQEAIAPTVVEPVSAETVIPESETVTETTISNVDNPTTVITETAVQETNNDEYKFCPNCGNMESGESIICSNCGSRL